MPKINAAAAPIDQLAGTYASRIIAALPLMWAQRLSMHDAGGNICWQSGDVWAPCDREAVRLALERFVGQSAPGRADHELPGQRTAVMLRAPDGDNCFRGFIMLVVNNRRLRAKGQSVYDLPVPVQRAAQDWGTSLAAAPAACAAARLSDESISPLQVDRLLAFGPRVDEPQLEEFFARLRAFPLALASQALTPLKHGTRIGRYEVLLRESPPSSNDTAPVALLRQADQAGLGTVLDRRVAGALIVWLAERNALFAEEPAQFSMNLSVSSLLDPNFVQFVQMCIAKAALWPALLAFEIDQLHWREHRAAVERLSAAIAAIGAGLVIDNATLDADTADLLNLPGVKLVKIARSLTIDLGTKLAQMRIAGLAEMARIAGAHSVAKQVDRSEEQELLRALGVDFIQGHATAIETALSDWDQQRQLRLVIDESVADLNGDG